MQERKGMLSREHGMSKGGGVWKPVEGGGAEWNNVEPAGELGVGSCHALSSRSLFPRGWVYSRWSCLGPVLPAQLDRCGLRKSLPLTCLLSPLCREALLPARRSHGGECPSASPLLLPCSPSLCPVVGALQSLGRLRRGTQGLPLGVTLPSMGQ